MRRFAADESTEGMRADVFVAQKLTGYTRSSLSRLFDRELVKVNENPAKRGLKLKTGDKLSVDDALLKQEPSPTEMPIIYEDKDVIVANKPAGILTHAKGALNEEATVASSLREKISSELIGNRAGIVHRLDRGTSGVIIIAKTQAALAYLQKQFASHSTIKIYKAIVEGKPTPNRAIIDAPIARNSRKPQTFQVDSSGKTAQTQYEVKETFKKDKKQYSLLQIKPVSGRTHQIRVHLKYIGHPVAGDHIYGHELSTNILLHASSLSLILPSGKRARFTAPTPSRFKEFMNV